MFQSITSVSITATAAYQTGEIVQTHGGGTFNLSKNIEVVASTGSTDMIDFSPDARKALQSFLSNGSTGMGTATGETGSGSSADPGDSVGISVTAATASTTGRQPDYATASDYDVSWMAADGQTGELGVEEGWSLTTNLQLVPLAPQLQDSGPPGVAANATNVTLSENGEGSLVSTAFAETRSSRSAMNGSEAALVMLEAASANLSQHGSDKKGDRSGSVPSDGLQTRS